MISDLAFWKSEGIVEEDSTIPHKIMPISYWKTTATNPCTINVSTLVEEPIQYVGENDRWETLSGVVANGKYFDNPNGEGKYLNIVAGQLVETIETINNVCDRGSVITYNSMPTPSSYDVYGNTMICAYAEEHIVVSYNMTSGLNPVGTIVAGIRGEVDIGLYDAPNRPRLNFPSFVKFNPDSGNFAVYSSGFCKSFKEFTISGTFIAQFMDNSLVPSTNQLLYNFPVDGQMAHTPLNPNGLIGLLTPDVSDTVPENIANDQWFVTGMDFVNTDGNQPTLFVGMWKYSNVERNMYKIYALARHDNDPSYNCVAIPIYEGSSYSAGSVDDELISDFCVTKKTNNYQGTGKTRVEIVLIRPRGLSYKMYQQYTMSWDFQLGLTMLITSGSFLDNGDFSYLVDNDELKYNVRAECRVAYNNNNSQRSILVSFMSYKIRRWDAIVAGLTNILATGGTLVAFGSLGLTLKGAATWGVIFENFLSLGLITVSGVLFSLVVIGLGVLVYILTRPKDQILYTTRRIVANITAEPTTYTYFVGHAVEDKNQYLHEAWFKTDGSESHILATNNSNSASGTDTIMYASLFNESKTDSTKNIRILKGPYNLKRVGTSDAFS